MNKKQIENAKEVYNEFMKSLSEVEQEKLKYMKFIEYVWWLFRIKPNENETNEKKENWN